MSSSFVSSSFVSSSFVSSSFVSSSFVLSRKLHVYIRKSKLPEGHKRFSRFYAWNSCTLPILCPLHRLTLHFQRSFVGRYIWNGEKGIVLGSSAFHIWLLIRGAFSRLAKLVVVEAGLATLVAWHRVRVCIYHPCLSDIQATDYVSQDERSYCSQGQYHGYLCTWEQECKECYAIV